MNKIRSERGDITTDTTEGGKKSPGTLLWTVISIKWTT